MKFSTIAAAILAPVAVLAQSDLKIIKPSASLWWVADSEFELKWTGQVGQFTTFIFNDDIQLMAAGAQGAQLNGITDGYRQSFNYPMFPGLNPGNGYYVKMVDPTNTTKVFATSEKFELKRKGSEYPPENAAATTASSGATGSSGSAASGTPTASQTSPATSSPTGGAGIVAAPVAFVAVAGSLVYAFA